MTATINRHYTHEVGGDLILEPYNLGPKVINGVPNLFEIPPALPPVGQWTLPDVVEDTASAKFPTTSLAPLAAPGISWTEQGKYQIKVDLFDTLGNLVNVDALSIKYRVPAVTDLSGTIPTENAADPSLIAGGTDPGSGLVRDDDGDGKKSFIMTLHIDNSLCKATIAAPLINGSPADNDCGVLKYDPLNPGSVSLSYEPRFPNGIGTEGFATYSFQLFRGANALSLPPGDPTPDIPDSGNVPHPPATVTQVQLTTDLLGSCPIAGFSENLYVAAKATNGWGRLGQYDASAVWAFVLAPKP